MPRLALPEGPLDPSGLFDPAPIEVWLEVGFGKGEHLAWQAACRPNVGLIGCEPYLEGVASLLAVVADEALANVRVYPDDARALIDRLAPASLARVFVLFPDPWPKQRHHKRRFLRRASLDALARVLADDAVLRCATDDGSYLAEILGLTLGHPDFLWPAEGPGAWRRPADMGPPSRCETRALAQGRRPVYLEFRRRARPQTSSSGR